MKRIMTLTTKDEIFFLPTIGIKKTIEYGFLNKERYGYNLCFVWLIWRIAIVIHKGDWREMSDE